MDDGLRNSHKRSHTHSKVNRSMKQVKKTWEWKPVLPLFRKLQQTEHPALRKEGVSTRIKQMRVRRLLSSAFAAHTPAVRRHKPTVLKKTKSNKVDKSQHRRRCMLLEFAVYHSKISIFFMKVM